jgi:DNA-directed RNA polymerase subunit H (RpoH/RPB5)
LDIQGVLIRKKEMPSYNKNNNQDYIGYIKKGIADAQIIQTKNIHYSELLVDSKYGEDYLMLDRDINLLQKTDFDNIGYKIFDIPLFNELMQRFIRNEISFITKKEISLENYHNVITEEEHTAILNSMPYKKDVYPDIKEFSDYLEKTVSEILGESVKIFNDDLWFRICRPSKINNNDYNPCHRDVYLDFYRNVLNIYLPIIGSNKYSSLKMEEGSHLWNEKDIKITKGGAFFKHSNKKYSVDAIVSSTKKLNMVKPNPNENEVLVFSPYLIHGCSDNNNTVTRMSLEVRFIKNDKNSINQESEYNKFVSKRITR